MPELIKLNVIYDRVEPSKLMDEFFRSIGLDSGSIDIEQLGSNKTVKYYLLWERGVKKHG